MKLYIEIFFYILIGVIMYFFDISDGHYKNCNSVKSHVFLLTHQILGNFLLFGILSNNKYVLCAYIVTFLVVLISQLLSSGYCPLTTYVNRECGVGKNEPLRDSMYYIGLKQNNSIYYISLCLFFSIVIYKWKRYEEIE